MAKLIKLEKVRCAFITLGEPEQYEGKGPFRWSATFLVPYDDPQRKMVESALRDVAREKWGSKGDKVLNSIIENILSDPKGCCWQDGKRKPEYDGFEGNFYLSAHRGQDKGRPLVIDNDKSPIYQNDNSLYPAKAGRIFSGCYVNAQVELWPQDNKNGKGLRATLMVVQRNRIGDAFGGGTKPTADDFGEVEDGADAEDLA